MGNLKSRYFDTMEITNSKEAKVPKIYVPVEEFHFQEPFEDDSNNGLFLNDVYFPEEIVRKILTYLPPEQLLSLSLVCKKWCNIIKSDSLWMDIYNDQFPNKAKRLPWYVYYLYFSTDNFKNMLKNGNGQEEFKHWKIIKNFGDQFRIEKVPQGSNPLPADVPEFYGHKSCFATSFYECNKIQVISLNDKRLLRYVLDKYSPHIYVSEWCCARFDCGSKYTLRLRGLASESKQKPVEEFAEEDDENEEQVLFEVVKSVVVEQWMGKDWSKVEMKVEKYDKSLKTLVFEHEGVDTQFWKGHYGSKMAGGVVKFQFESMQPIEEQVEVALD